MQDGRKSGLMARILDWAMSAGFWRLLLVSVASSELLTFAMNTINSYIWWGSFSSDLILIGVVDALVVSFIVASGLLLLLARLRTAERDSAGMSAYLDNILRTSTDMAIAATDTEFCITLFNPAAEEMFGYKAEEIMGKDARHLPGERGIDSKRFGEAMAALQRYGDFSFSVAQKRTDGGQRFLDLRISGIKDQYGALAGYVLMAKDVTERRKALGMLAESEERFRSLVESTSDWVWEMDALSRYTYSSPKVKDILGFRPDEVIGKSPYDMMMPVEARRTKSMFGVYASVGKPFMALVSTNVHRDGRLIVLETSGVPIYDQQGELRGYRGISRDITGRRRFETALRESEAKFRLLSEESLVGVYIIQDHRFVYVNPTFAQITGYDRNDIVKNKRLEDLITPNSMGIVNENIRKRLSGEARSTRYELQGIRSDGTIIDVEVLGSVTTYNGLPAIIGTLIDVTDRKKTERALKESESKFRTLVEHSLIGVAIIQDGRHVYVNPRHAEMLGYTQAEMTSFGSAMDVVHQDDREMVAENIRMRMTGEVKSNRYQFRFLRKDGGTVHVEVHGSQTEYNGRPAVMGSVLDITERINAEKALRESEERYRRLVEQAADALVVHDIEGRIREVNSQACSMLGYSREELLSLSIQDLDDIIPPESLEGIWKIMKPGEPITSESVARRKDGSLLPVEIRVGVVETAEGRLLQALVRDITERKRAENAILELNEGLERMVEERTAELAEREHSYRTLAENLPAIVYRVYLRDGNRMQCFNQMLKPLTGYAIEELSPGQCCSIDPFIFIGDRERVVDVVKSAVADDVPFLVEYRLLHKDGGIRHMQERGKPVRGADGRPLYIDGVILDVTERVQAQQEREAMQARLNEVQKMEAVGNLAGGIAHDFNNLLTVIQGDTELAKRFTDEQGPAYECLAQVGRAASRASELIKKLLLFSRRKPMARLPMNINDAIDDILGMLGRIIGDGIEVMAELGPDIWTINADASGIEQVVMNLALNARDAMPDGGRLRIKTQNAELDDDACRTTEGARPGRFVRLTVADTGRGMDEENMKRIFEPFFTTKGRGRGTGLGLSVVYGIVKEHGGWINVTSEPGRGSTFDVFLEALDYRV